MEQGTTTYIVLKELAGNPPPKFNAIQELLLPHVDTLIHFWTAVWIVTIIAIAYKVWYEYTHEREGSDR